MKEEIDISEAREIWNSPSPQMDKDQIDRAYESIGGYILRSRISNLHSRQLPNELNINC